MKTKFTLLAVLLAVGTSLFAQQQPPNAGFNTWTDSLAPDGWVTYESIFGQSLGLSKKETVDKVEGAASVKLTSDSIQAFPAYGVVPGMVTLGTSSGPTSFNGVPFPTRPDTIFFAYKYTTVNSAVDSGYMLLRINANGAPYFTGGILLPPAANWTGAGIFFTYPDNTQSDSLLLQFGSSGLDVSPKGSSLYVDALRFAYKTAPVFIDEIDNNITVTVYPNPAKDVVNVVANEIPQYATIMVFDLQGRVVTHQFMEGTTHQFNTGTWSNGIYTYSIVDSKGRAVNKGRFAVSK